jgi:2-methylcitrate dehydratase PrpD
MSAASQATEAVTTFVTRASLRTIPPEAVGLAKQCITDGLGVILAGSTSDASAIVRDFVQAAGGTPEATVFGPQVGRSSASHAALANGVAGHALDFDDTQLSSAPDRIFGLLTHPTIPPLSAALAIGERVGASGGALLEAFLVGFEVECKLAEAIDPSHYRKGFHSSGTLGAFGAAIASAKLLQLDETQLAHALAITAGMSSGIRVNFGTMSKPLHVGRAAQNGVVAAELASRGFTGGGHALDGEWGFLKVYGFGQEAEATRLVGALGMPYSIVSPGVSIKPYPCGSLGHPSMDAMLKLVLDHDVKPADVTAIRLRAGSNILNPLRYAVAHTELEAKFCPAFMMASLVLRRKAGIHEFTDAFVASAPVQEMMKKVTTVRDAAIEAKGFDRMRSVVEVDLVDGRTLSQAADERYRGGPEHPFTRDDVLAKFTECAELILDADAIAEAFELVQSLEQVPDIRMLVRAVSRVSADPSAAPASIGR